MASSTIWPLIAAAMLFTSCSLNERQVTPVAAPAPSASAARPPNLIIILADDLGHADVSTYRKGRFATPNIDRIGREGAVFLQGYASAPICSPSRAGLLTGRHQQRFGFEYNTGAAQRDIGERRGLPATERTIADALRAAGYRTGALGKWHLGSSEAQYPTHRGFDEFWGFLTGQTNHIRPDAPDAVNARSPATGLAGFDLVRPFARVAAANAVIKGPGRERVDLGDGLLTEQLTAQAIDFVERHRDRPFFLYLAHHAPHTPLQVTRKYYDRFAHIEDRSQRVYAAMIQALDEGVGALLDRLDALNLSRDTLVVFLSDNGCAAYLPGLCSGEPVSGGKLTLLEGGIRIPFLVRWPAQIAAGTRHQAPVSTLDVLPTLLRAAGVPLPADHRIDGQDLLGQLQAPGNARGDALHWRSQPMRALRQAQWKYIRDLDGIEFLYDLDADPRELRNLAGTDAVRLDDMRRSFEQWEADKRAPAWQPARVTSFDFEGRHFSFRP